MRENANLFWCNAAKCKILSLYRGTVFLGLGKKVRCRLVRAIKDREFEVEIRSAGQRRKGVYIEINGYSERIKSGTFSLVHSFVRSVPVRDERRESYQSKAHWVPPYLADCCIRARYRSRKIYFHIRDATWISRIHSTHSRRKSLWIQHSIVENRNWSVCFCFSRVLFSFIR